MVAKGFDFAGLASPPIEREFFPHEGMKAGEGIKLMLNLDFLTLEKMESLEAGFNAIFDETANSLRDLIAPPPAKGRRKSNKLAVTGTKPEELPKIELFAFEKAKFRFFAGALAGQPGSTDPTDRLIHGWDVVRDGKPVPISYEAFLQMPPHGLSRLYRFCVGEANNPTTSEKKPSSSP